MLFVSSDCGDAVVAVEFAGMHYAAADVYAFPRCQTEIDRAAGDFGALGLTAAGRRPPADGRFAWWPRRHHISFVFGRLAVWGQRRTGGAGFGRLHEERLAGRQLYGC